MKEIESLQSAQHLLQSRVSFVFHSQSQNSIYINKGFTRLGNEESHVVYLFPKIRNDKIYELNAGGLVFGCIEGDFCK